MFLCGKMLLSAGALVDVPDVRGKTALMKAAGNEYIQIVEVRILL